MNIKQDIIVTLNVNIKNEKATYIDLATQLNIIKRNIEDHFIINPIEDIITNESFDFSINSVTID